MKSAITLAFAALAAALPAPQAGTTTPLNFEGMAIRSGSPIHLSSINANGQAFFIGKNTTTYCPEGSAVGASCSGLTSDKTIFSYLNGNGGLALDTEVPGGQTVYVSHGILKFTQAHSASTDGTPVYDGFATAYDAKFQFEGKDWLACPVDGGAYQIHAESRTSDSSDCLGFVWKVVQVDDSTPAAWQYV